MKTTSCKYPLIVCSSTFLVPCSSDGHVAHHLFFTKIPHYNLPIATKAIKSYMIKNGLGWMYKSENTYDFVYRTHKYFLDFGFKSHRAPKTGVMPPASAATVAASKKQE